MKTFQEFMAKDSPLLGLYVTMPDPTIIELAKMAGYDFVRIDGEHYPFDITTVAEMIRTGSNLDLPVHMRIPNMEDVTKLIDFGLTGVVVPNCNTVERAREAIQLTRFHPLGVRGMGGLTRAVHLAGCSFLEYINKANSIVTLVIQIEDVCALDCLDEMLSLKGIDMVTTGTADISQSLGIPAQINDPRVTEIEDTIIRKTLEYGKQPCIRVDNRERFEELSSLGVKVFPLGSDEVMLQKALKHRIQEFRSKLK
jgi:2-keto-3-deoxy-L-rhamnonate aldolase RhmA